MTSQMTPLTTSNNAGIAVGSTVFHPTYRNGIIGYMACTVEKITKAGRLMCRMEDGQKVSFGTTTNCSTYCEASGFAAYIAS